MLSKEQGITVLGACAVYEVTVILTSNKKQKLSMALMQVSVKL